MCSHQSKQSGHVYGTEQRDQRERTQARLDGCAMTAASVRTSSAAPPHPVLLGGCLGQKFFEETCPCRISSDAVGLAKFEYWK
jgi:hypothetical protein